MTILKSGNTKEGFQVKLEEYVDADDFLAYRVVIADGENILYVINEYGKNNANVVYTSLLTALNVNNFIDLVTIDDN